MVLVNNKSLYEVTYVDIPRWREDVYHEQDRIGILEDFDWNINEYLMSYPTGIHLSYSI